MINSDLENIKALWNPYKSFGKLKKKLCETPVKALGNPRKSFVKLLQKLCETDVKALWNPCKSFVKPDNHEEHT